MSPPTSHVDLALLAEVYARCARDLIEAQGYMQSMEHQTLSGLSVHWTSGCSLPGYLVLQRRATQDLQNGLRDLLEVTIKQLKNDAQVARLDLMMAIKRGQP